jgi:hypothetical protein
MKVLTVALLAFGLTTVLATCSADAQVMDCRSVDCSRRAECNRNVLAALVDLNTTLTDRFNRDSGTALSPAIAVLRQRQEQLRSFVYEHGCVAASASCPGAPPVKPVDAGASLLERWRRFWAAVTDWQPGAPAFAAPLYADGDRACAVVAQQRVDATRALLVGRWDGWQGVPGNRGTRVAFNLIRVTGRYVKACSDQGMVNGTIEADGSLVLPRLRALDADYRLKLWHVAGREELRGAALLAIEPGTEIPTGPVWISKKLEPGDADGVPDSCEE